MIEKRTVFILGAGASCPYGFPDTLGLRREILTNFPGHYGGFFGPSGKRYADEPYPPISTVTEFLNAFDRSNTPSIDLFLSRRPQYHKLGKLAILASILWAESGSCFGERVKERKHDWYFHLYGKLTQELDSKDAYREFAKNRIAFITFNYDRSLEHFLFDTLLNSFDGATLQAVQEQIDQVPIIHVYGRVAPLPWQADGLTKSHKYADYQLGAPPNLIEMIDNVYVIHEERTNPQLEKARALISQAERIFLLGFGYAKENLEALGFPSVLRPVHYIYGTAMGFNTEEIEGKKRYFVRGLAHSGINSTLAGHQVKIDNCDCVQLLLKCDPLA